MTAARIMLILASAMAAGACGGQAATPTSPSTTTTVAPILFSGTLQPKASRFYSYTITTAGTVTAMLASLERGGVPVTNMLELGLGIPAGTGCATDVASNTNTALIPQLRRDVLPGTYCVRIADTDGLPAPMTFTIRVVHP